MIFKLTYLTHKWDTNKYYTSTSVDLRVMASDVETPVLELWRVWSSPLLPLLPGPL